MHIKKTKRLFVAFPCSVIHMPKSFFHLLDWVGLDPDYPNDVCVCDESDEDDGGESSLIC